MINQILDLLVPAASTILELSIKSSVLILLIIILKAIFRFKLPPQWHYALWFILVIRLLIPFDITTQYDFLNFNNIMKTDTDRNEYVIDNEMDESAYDENEISNLPVESQEAIQINTEQRNELIMRIMISVWLLGIIILLAFLFRTNRKISTSIRNKKLVKDELTLQVLKDCSKRMNIRSNLALCESEQVKIPFLFGLIRPKIIIPANVCSILKRTELSHVFLHELSHYKRLDILTAWITAIVNVIHWFNPVIWLAFYLMRVDREIACDGNALKYLSNKERLQYGQSILRFIEKNRYEVSIPIAVGLFNNKFELSRRLKMLKHKSGIKTTSKIAFILSILILITVFFVKSYPSQQQDMSKYRVAIVAEYFGSNNGRLGTEEKNILISISNKVRYSLRDAGFNTDLVTLDKNEMSQFMVKSLIDSIQPDITVYLGLNSSDNDFENRFITHSQEHNRRSSQFLDSILISRKKGITKTNYIVNKPTFRVTMVSTDIIEFMIETGSIKNENDLKKISQERFHNVFGTRVKSAVLRNIQNPNFIKTTNSSKFGINYKLRRPVDSGVVTSKFGMRTHPVLKVERYHDGIDISAPKGTEVCAAADGYICFSGRKNDGFGNVVSIEHADSITTNYAHLHEIKVNTGQEVKRGELVGWVGNSGLTTVPHLHFEVKINGKFVDPMEMIYTNNFIH